MKKTISFEIEFKDEYVKDWENRYLDFHTKLYKDKGMAEKMLAENPIENAVANELEDYMMNAFEGEIISIKRNK